MLTLWKSLIRSKLEYCCQLWNPSRKGYIQMLEQVQRNFIQKITGMEQQLYWEQLHALSMHSLERRCERYLIIYTWRIMDGQVPNISESNRGGIKEKWHIRRGRVCIVPTVNSQTSGSLRSLYYTSLAIHGPRLFNSIPVTIRNMTVCSMDPFKQCLDKYLRRVLDEPHISGYTALRRAESNSLFDMGQFASAQLVSTMEEPDPITHVLFSCNHSDSNTDLLSSLCCSLMFYSVEIYFIVNETWI